MSILIKGMDMPKDCAECSCCVDVGQGNETEYFCSAEDCAPDIQDITAGRLKTCRLVNIPTPHGRLIDADRLIAVLKSTTSISQSDYDLFNHVIGLIEHQPVIIEAEK